MSYMQNRHLKLNKTHPLTVSQASPANQPTKVEKICSVCLTIIGKGMPHICKKSTFRENMRQLVSIDMKVREQTASSVIALKVASRHGTIRVAQPTG